MNPATMAFSHTKIEISEPEQRTSSLSPHVPDFSIYQLRHLVLYIYLPIPSPQRHVELPRNLYTPSSPTTQLVATVLGTPAIMKLPAKCTPSSVNKSLIHYRLARAEVHQPAIFRAGLSKVRIRTGFAGAIL